MAWYKAGSISVETGNKIVAGVGTDFITNIKIGFGLRAPDFEIYEIESIDSALQITLSEAYRGATAGGQPYKIFPTQGVIVDLSTQVATLLSTFGPFRDAYESGELKEGLNLKGVLDSEADLPETPAVGDAYLIGTVIYAFSSVSGWVHRDISGPAGPSNVLSIGTVTRGDDAAATLSGVSPNQELNLVLPKGDTGDQGEQGINGASNILTIGTVTSGDEPSAEITGESPDQTLNLVLVKGDLGPEGPANVLTIGTVSSGEVPGVVISGTSPSQTLDFVLQKGDKGESGQSFTVNASGPRADRDAFDTEVENFSYLSTDEGLLYTHAAGAGMWNDGVVFGKGEPGSSNELTIGTVDSGGEASATITGASPEQVLNLVLPMGPAGAGNVLTVGTVTTGTEPAVTITGDTPTQVINFVLPKGIDGTRFSAFLSASIALTSGVPTKIVFDSEEYDANVDYSTSDGRFTVKSDGYFALSASAYLTATDMVSATLILHKNGAPYRMLDGQIVGGILNGTTDIAASASDYFEVFATVVGVDGQVGGGLLFTVFSASEISSSKGDKGDRGMQGDPGEATPGIVGGYAPLSSSLLIPSIYLPSYVDDVVEAATVAALPTVGEAGKIYVITTGDDIDKEYRWSGTAYRIIVSSPGTTDAITEGSAHLFFTEARVRAIPLTGLSLATSTPIVSTDTEIVSFGKLQAQVTLRASSTGGNTFSGAQRGTVVALTDGATVTPDFSLSNNFSLTLAGSRTLANPASLAGMVGQSGIVSIAQDATGSRTLAFGSFYKFKGGVAPVLTTTASAIDEIAYYIETTSRIWMSLVGDVR